jgi:hypothetical protein
LVCSYSWLLQVKQLQVRMWWNNAMVSSSKCQCRRSKAYLSAQQWRGRLHWNWPSCHRIWPLESTMCEQSH